jgi:dihydrofolate reductase
VWPDMTRDERTDPRTRDLGRWLNATEKVVVSRTLTDAPWENSRITRDLTAEVEQLRQAPGRDVLVLNSASVIAELLRQDLVDDLRLALVPVLVGGGLRLFPDGVDGRFHTAGVTALEHGAVGLHLRRP